MARDIPCQAACPAGTNVPEYIRQLVLNDPDASYRINQEDNAFPGVLGRICTRPCEPACRHQWTNTNGPVTICHLKRAAADNKSQPAQPLAAWFDEPTGKRIAVIGGGPAGLVAARQLKRLKAQRPYPYAHLRGKHQLQWLGFPSNLIFDDL